MKKGMIYLIALWVVLLGGIFIYSKIKNSGIPVDSTPKANKPTNEKVSLDEYPYIDYTGYYTENDLKIEKIEFNTGLNYSTYIKISGLKDKELEERLNKMFYDEAKGLANEGYDRINSLPTINAFNILSVTIKAYLGGMSPKTIYHNIDLTTGNEIKLDDILNTKNITRIVASAYYNSASYTIKAERRQEEITLDHYDYCINHSEINCGDVFGQRSLEEVNQQIALYDKYISELEDESLKYARNFDLNQEFYISPAGIIIENYTIHDIQYVDPIRILINDNPRLFNFYYKYNTKDSIFDGSYEGKKNLLYAQYNRYIGNEAPYDEILDNVIIHREFIPMPNEDDQINKRNLADTALKNHLKTLDKNITYYIYGLSIHNDYLYISQNSMTNDVYNNEFIQLLRDKQMMSHSTSDYIESDNISNESYYLYLKNPNVYTMYKDGIQVIYIRNNQEKADEINSFIKTNLEELKKNGEAYMSIDMISESKIQVKIVKYTGDRQEITETFDI